MKTIFYKISENENGNFWFNNKPYNEWFTLENVLYEPNGNIRKRTIIPKNNTNYIHSITVIETLDTFSDNGIIRRIALHISEY